MGSSLCSGSTNTIPGANNNTNIQQYRQSGPQQQQPPAYFQNRYPYGINASPESAISPSISSVATSTSEVSFIHAIFNVKKFLMQNINSETTILSHLFQSLYNEIHKPIPERMSVRSE